MTPKSTAPTSLTWSGVTARRMARHALTEPAIDPGPADIAGVLCGAHAQTLSAAALSIGRRIAGATRADVQRALWEDRILIKTFGPRGTVHLLATADLPMWTGAWSALPSSVPMHPDPVRFTPQQADEVVATIGDALADSEREPRVERASSRACVRYTISAARRAAARVSAGRLDAARARQATNPSGRTRTAPVLETS